MSQIQGFQIKHSELNGSQIHTFKLELRGYKNRILSVRNGRKEKLSEFKKKMELLVEKFPIYE